MALVREVIQVYKSEPCADCFNTFPFYVMEFDHVRGKKAFCITAAAAFVGWDKFWAEIDKCDVVCANCHRVRTHERRQQRGACRKPK